MWRERRKRRDLAVIDTTARYILLIWNMEGGMGSTRSGNGRTTGRVRIMFFNSSTVASLLSSTQPISSSDPGTGG